MFSDLKNIKHIAVLRLSALGDVVLMVPVVRAIQRRYPDAKISWIIDRSAYSIVDGLKGVDFIVIDKPNSISDYWRLKQQLKKYRFDVLLAAQASLRANLIYPLIKAPIKIGFDKVRSRDGHSFFINRRIDFQEEHLLDGFMRFARALGVDDLSLQWDLPIESADWDWAKQQLSLKKGPWIAINPAASKKERLWLVDRYAAVIDEASKRWGVNVVLTGGLSKEEKRLAQQIVEKSKTDCLNLVGKSSMKQLAALLGSVNALVSPDTGPVHIATALGTPVVGLYAVAPPKLSGPYLSPELVINKYPAAVKQILQQDPNKITWATRVHDPKAMALITVDEVIEKLSLVLERL